MNKKILIFGVILLTIFIGVYFLLNRPKNSSNDAKQKILSQTLSISKKYTLLRYRTEKVLEKAKDYQDYDKWNNEISEIIEDWGELDKQSQGLETEADKLTQDNTSYFPVTQIMAYDLQEANNIINNSPPLGRISALAKHYGVDAKMAQLILNQTQDQISREAYGVEGDVFQTCENNSMRIKNGAKVTVFVGTIVATGGTSALAASGTLAQTAVVVSGADLVLEVTEDEARIALGDKNKVTNMASKIRTVTEPAAGILSIVNMSGNVSKAIDKFGVAYIGAEQIRSVVQDEKILGISIKIDEKGKTKSEIASLSKEELIQWKEDNRVVDSTQSLEEIINQLIIEIEKEKPTDVPKEDSKKETPKTNSGSNSNQIYKIVNVSGSSYMMDVCLSSTCWDDLAANVAEDRDVGGIYTMGKVYGPGEGFKSGFRPSEVKASGKLVETSPNSYKITVYFAIAPFEGPKHKTIEYGTWLSKSVEINANYGEEPVIEWDGSSLKQAK